MGGRSCVHSLSIMGRTWVTMVWYWSSPIRSIPRNSNSSRSYMGDKGHASHDPITIWKPSLYVHLSLPTPFLQQGSDITEMKLTECRPNPKKTLARAPGCKGLFGLRGGLAEGEMVSEGINVWGGLDEDKFGVRWEGVRMGGGWDGVGGLRLEAFYWWFIWAYRHTHTYMIWPPTVHSLRSCMENLRLMFLFFDFLKFIKKIILWFHMCLSTISFTGLPQRFRTGVCTSCLMSSSSFSLSTHEPKPFFPLQVVWAHLPPLSTVRRHLLHILAAAGGPAPPYSSLICSFSTSVLCPWLCRRPMRCLSLLPRFIFVQFHSISCCYLVYWMYLYFTALNNFISFFSWIIGLRVIFWAFPSSSSHLFARFHPCFPTLIYYDYNNLVCYNHGIIVECGRSFSNNRDRFKPMTSPRFTRPRFIRPRFFANDLKSYNLNRA